MKQTKLFMLFCLVGMLTYMACNPKATTDIKKQSMPGPRIGETPTKVIESTTDLFKRKLPVDKEVRVGTLPNGMKYYIRKNQKPENRAELRLVVNAGAMQEDEDQRGLAHFVEHMAFNGTKNFKKSELVDYLEGIGAQFGPDLNAYTSFDETVYMLQLPTDDEEIMDKGFLILEDWATNIAFEEEEIDKERGVVVSEWRTGLGASERMRNKWFPVVFHKSRYAERLPIGKKDIIEKASYETIKRFYNKWYRPDLMALVVVGDVDVDKTESRIKKQFGKIENPSTPVNRKNYPIPDHDETLVAIATDKEASYTSVQVLYKHDKVSNENIGTFRDDLKRQLYNRMLNQRLDELTRAADPPYLYAYSGYSGFFRVKDAYQSYVSTAEDGIKRGLKTILIENERVRRYGFNPSELDRQKIDLMKSLERAVKEKDKTASRRFASLYVYNFLEANPIINIEDRLKLTQELLPSIKVEEINLLAKKWIQDKNRAVVVTAPEKEGLTIPTEVELRAILAEVPKVKIEPYEDEVVDAPLLAKKLAPSKIVTEKKLKKINVTELTLANGIRIVLKPTDFKNDEILMRAFSFGGHSLYADEDYPSIVNAGAIIKQSGLGQFDATQLEKQLTGKTVSIAPFIGELYEGFNGFAAPQDLETLLQMTYMYFTDVRADEQAFQSFKTRQLAIYKNLMSNPQYYFYDQVSRISNNNHPRRGFATEKMINTIELKKVHQFYKERFSDASDFTFIFIGNFEVENMKSLLATYLGNLPASNKKESWKDLNITKPKGLIDKVIKKGEAPKSMVNIQFHGDFKYTAQNNYDYQSMLSVLRIMMRESMREDKGGVYGVQVSGSASQIPKKRYASTISFLCAPEDVDELVKTALKDIETLQAEGPTEEKLNKIKETQRRSREKSLKENRFWQRQLEAAYMYDSNPEAVLEYDKYVEGLKVEAVQAAAKKYFNLEAYIKVVMMPEKATTK